MEFNDLIKLRRSTRSYTDKSVPSEVILDIFEQVKHAPCSCNRQFWKFIVVDKQTFQKKLQKHCSTIAAINPPQVIFALYDTRYNNENHANYQSVAGAVMTLIYAAKDRGVDSCWMAGFGDEVNIRKELAVPDRFRVVCAICIGYGSDHHDIRAKKRPVLEILDFNEYSEKVCIPNSWNPKDWSRELHAKNLDYTVFAKSPSAKFYKPYMRNEFQAGLKWVPKIKGKILYFNPFAGNYLIPLIKEGMDFTVWSISEQVSEFIKNKCENEGVVSPNFITSLDKTSLKDESYDAVFCFDQLEKFSKKDQEFFLSEFKRVLKPKGRMYVMRANWFSPYWISWKLSLIFSKTGPGLRGAFRPALPWEHLKGFKLVSSEGISIFPKMLHSKKSKLFKYFTKTLAQVYEK